MSSMNAIKTLVKLIQIQIYKLSISAIKSKILIFTYKNFLFNLENNK